MRLDGFARQPGETPTYQRCYPLGRVATAEDVADPILFLASNLARHITGEILKGKIIDEKSKGKLVLITSHILSELDDLISQVIYMQDGKLCFHKSITALRDDTGEEKLSKAIARVMLQS